MALPMQQSVLEGMRPELGGMNGLRAPPNVPMRKTHTIRNDVNLKKTSLSLLPDESHESRYHLEFQFDASTECGISVYYAAKDHTAPDGSITFTTLKPEGALPKEYRDKGLGQTYRTQASFALDISTYQKSELTFTPAVDRFPIIVCLEAGGEMKAPYLTLPPSLPPSLPGEVNVAPYLTPPSLPPRGVVLLHLWQAPRLVADDICQHQPCWPGGAQAQGRRYMCAHAHAHAHARLPTSTLLAWRRSQVAP